MTVILLSGVHGVGKGYLGAPVAASLGLDYGTASQLICNEKGRANWAKDKSVSDVSDNQLALVRALGRRRQSENPILLDGHFVLRDATGGIVRVAKEVFASLHLSGCVLLCDKPEVIANRLMYRDGVLTSFESIAELAAEEAAHAHHVCDELGIPLIVIESPDESLVRSAVLRLLAR